MEKITQEFLSKFSTVLQKSVAANKKAEEKAIANGLQKRWNKNLKKYVWIKK